MTTKDKFTCGICKEVFEMKYARKDDQFGFVCVTCKTYANNALRALRCEGIDRPLMDTDINDNNRKDIE